MRFRDPEAARIEDDYFLRLGKALSRLPAEQRNEILQNVREHVQLALGAGGVVTLVEMAQVLQQLGSPEAMAAEATGGSAQPAAGPAHEGNAPPIDLEYAHPAAGLTPDQYPQAAFILRRLWIATIISSTGVFVPVTGPEIAGLIGSATIAATVLAYRGGVERPLRTVGRLEIASIVLDSSPRWRCCSMLRPTRVLACWRHCSVFPRWRVLGCPIGKCWAWFLAGRMPLAGETLAI